MTVAGVFGLLKGKPRQPLGADGRMALADHLREFRARMLKVALILTVGIVVAWFFYDQLFGLILGPYNDARGRLGGSVDTEPYIAGAGGPLLLQLKISALAAVVLGSPLWLYQVWAFIVPGLHSNEKRWTRLFAVVAGPLFMAGVGLGYYVLPKGLEVLLSFTPANVQSLLEFGDYFRFFTRMMLVFGVSFEIPLFVVLLNLAGVLSGKALGAHRPWIILGTFVFAAVATPSTDPFSMIMLAVPMTLLFLVSEIVARTVDRRRARKRAAGDLSNLSDDEASPLDSESDSSDYRRSDLDEGDD
ncbi:MAG TPA: twin-arginine translocase subunit TatC [Nocardioidaceae bacterium]|nr:twin-arginine translocase subunit TatC [Nocardioidaceae bacterium]